MVMIGEITVGGWSDLGCSRMREDSTYQVFDKMPNSGSDEWRSPNRILEVTIHRVLYPITENLLHRVFRPFGDVEQVHVFGGLDVAFARVVFSSKHAAADDFGELHGRHIYDGCCQMDIKWGLSTKPAVAVVSKDGDTVKSSSSKLFSCDVVALSSIELISEKVSMALDPSGAQTTTTGSALVHDDSCVNVLDVINHGGVNSIQAPVQSTITVLPAIVSAVAVASTGTALVPTAGSSSIVVLLITVSDVVGQAIDDELPVPTAATNSIDDVIGSNLFAMASSSSISIVLATYSSTKYSDHITGDFMAVSVFDTQLLLFSSFVLLDSITLDGAQSMVLWLWPMKSVGQQPWPPPMHLKVVSFRPVLRPRPWPSFWYRFQVQFQPQSMLSQKSATMLLVICRVEASFFTASQAKLASCQEFICVCCDCGFSRTHDASIHEAQEVRWWCDAVFILASFCASGVQTSYSGFFSCTHIFNMQKIVSAYSLVATLHNE